MNNKPQIFFWSLIGLALILIFTYQIKMNPFDQLVQTQQSAVADPHQQDNAIALFTQNCSKCHGSFGEGKGVNPSLKDNKIPHDQIAALIRSGKGEMPSFQQLTDEQVHQLVSLVEKM